MGDDFYEILDYCAFDVEKASALNGDVKPLREIINEMLEEAGLDAVEDVSTKPA